MNRESAESAQRLVLGEVEVIRVVEWQGPFGPARGIVPEAGAELWKSNEEWLAPDHWAPESDSAVMALQSWVLRSGGRTILVDTGVGDGRERPHSPQFHRRRDGFLGRLERAGVRPEDVDVVVNTHVHADHVGWNTRAGEGDGGWVPTFPNAEYLVPAADDFHYGPANGYGGGLQEEDRLVYEESVAPVHRAGQVRLWDGEHRVDENLTLEAAPGHTPGSAVLRLASGGDRAVFVGDLVHSPVQLLEPSCGSCFCLDPGRAAVSRRRILERAADERELVVPAHFGGAGAVEVRREGEGFGLVRWAAYGTG
ncbi:MBL fold metallo-hydrolase [Streptomyces narbonensis]|uniref:MBL fold metallo-hydrolase n=1 Tax=Streptomyces narbonensis TaxID=67333 RepID=UPI0016764350|nr:MBL fold metallo-hydrolase [Streptomyces narbonensis]GGV98048.1 MBL fold metallo-hydrolase [Streptomyces narbonensis]